MNTPAHALIAAACFSKQGALALNVAVVAGSLFPDAMIFYMFGWEKWVNGLTESQIFDQAYFSAYWQNWFAITNSIPLYVGLAVIGLAVGWRILFGFAAAAALHSALDFPLHHDDGRAHFWPFSEWVFESPVSYWDPNHYGLIVGPIESVIALIAAVVLWRRFPSLWIRALLIIAMAMEAYIAFLWAFLFKASS